MTDHDRSFVVRFFVEEDHLIGARWWNESFQTSAALATGGLGRRPLVWLGGGALALALGYRCVRSARDGWLDDDDDIASAVEALELQRREGWNVGRPEARLVVPYASMQDIDGGRDWKSRLPSLAQALAPTDERLLPYYVPTLLQVLSQPRSHALREALYPMRSPEMDASFEKAKAFGALVADADRPKDLAVILDLFGPDSVAAAAALAEDLTPVFAFDNWPHPQGVVPSHQTLAAAIYYLPRLASAASARPAAAPPLFVLDDARLTPYRDEASQFDNRYMARLPTADGLKGIGVRRVMYVRPAGTAPQELDDLNEDFVAYRQAGLEVKMLSLGDFQPGPAADAGAGGTVTRQYWGGSPHTHVHFWPTYGWYRPFRYSWAPAPAPMRGAPPQVLPRPASLAYQPALRPTIFSSRAVGGLAGVGKQKPSGFGRVSVRTSRRTGAVTGVGWRRSGSFGRSRSSWSG